MSESAPATRAPTALQARRVPPSGEPVTFFMAARLARRELRSGLKGFATFLACLTLGVGAIATVQSVAGAITLGLHEDGRLLLGGDVLVRSQGEPLPADAVQALGEAGTVSLAVEMRAMARRPDADASALVELKAVDSAYPLYGDVTLQGGGALQADLAGPGLVADSLLLDRLGVQVGDSVRLGTTTFTVRGVIDHEPDRVGTSSFALGPRVMVAAKDLEASGLEQTGSLAVWNYRLRLNSGQTPAALEQTLEQRFPQGAWRVRDAAHAAPQLEQFVGRLAQFLSLVGLASLLVGGLGISNAVRAYLEGRRRTIAILKCVGASGSLIFWTYLLQVMALAALGIVLGLAWGVLAPPVAGVVLADLLPIPTTLRLYPEPLILAATFGVLTTLTFTLWPLGRARQVAAASLFRDVVAPIEASPRPRTRIAVGVTGLVLAALAIFSAADPRLAGWFVGGALVTMAVLALVARGIIWGTAHLPRLRWPSARLALANLNRHGNATVAVVSSLGMGLTVLVAVALIEGNFRRQVQDSIPTDAPAFFFVDIGEAQQEPLRAAVLAVPGASHFEEVPSMRGRIMAAKGVPVEQLPQTRHSDWVKRGDRGVTYAATMPARTHLVSGNWWPADYQGPPLVSLYADLAEALGVGVGDDITINILGRDLTARVASIREIDWSQMTINFTIIFSPGVLEGAPHTYLATVQASAAAEAQVQHAVVSGFDTVTVIRVKDALEQVSDLIAKIGMAARITGTLTLVSGILVLAGAIAAGHRRRVYDAVVLKVLGATRGDILCAFLLEYGLLGLVAALVAGGLGTAAAWAVMTRIMEWHWTFLPSVVLATTALSVVLTLVAGFIGTWRALGRPAAPLLRNE